jgi:hypothetical protein
MLRGRGSQGGLTNSMPASSFRIGSLQPFSGAPLAAGCAMEELRKEAGAIVLVGHNTVLHATNIRPAVA